MRYGKPAEKAGRLLRNPSEIIDRIPADNAGISSQSLLYLIMIIVVSEPVQDLLHAELQTRTPERNCSQHHEAGIIVPYLRGKCLHHLKRTLDPVESSCEKEGLPSINIFPEHIRKTRACTSGIHVAPVHHDFRPLLETGEHRGTEGIDGDYPVRILPGTGSRSFKLTAMLVERPVLPDVKHRAASRLPGRTEIWPEHHIVQIDNVYRIGFQEFGKASERHCNADAAHHGGRFRQRTVVRECGHRRKNDAAQPYPAYLVGQRSLGSQAYHRLKPFPVQCLQNIEKAETGPADSGYVMDKQYSLHIFPGSTSA